MPFTARISAVPIPGGSFYPNSRNIMFPTARDIGKACGDQKKTKICYQTSVPSMGQASGKARKSCPKNHPEVMTMRGEVQEQKDNSPKERESLRKPVPHEEIVKVPFADNESGKTFRMRRMLEENHNEGLIQLIREYEDIFAWRPEDMPGIDTSVSLHQLHVDSMYKPVKQKKRPFNDEKNQAVRAEADLLLKAGAIRELQFPEWVANVVLVKKPNGA
ncbi:hypothetical protein LIER_17541 [Lithospermum erythrorhizon]|uniref:Uncharacterized protein n=1 Tax=Lithospermum erythrorhizon TaxID=34254 RepID=A0AAV3QAQ9_LITER